MCAAPQPSGALVTNVFPLCFICLLCHHSTSHHYAIFIVMVRTHEHSTTVITTNLCSWIFTAVRHTLTTLKLWNVVKSIFTKVSIILPTALIEGSEVWYCYATPQIFSGSQIPLLYRILHTLIYFRIKSKVYQNKCWLKNIKLKPNPDTIKSYLADLSLIWIFPTKTQLKLN